jgi:amphi-Trp domain-containing protein
MIAYHAHTMANKRDRDIEKVYTTPQFVAKLRRLADALETGEPFTIEVAGERIRVPAQAVFNVEHEREGDEEEVEFQMKWKRRADAKGAATAARRRSSSAARRRSGKRP